MARIIWLLLVALVLYVIGPPVWQAAQKALTPQHRVHSDL
jgi:hypothetical protein